MHKVHFILLLLLGTLALGCSKIVIPPPKEPLPKTSDDQAVFIETNSLEGLQARYLENSNYFDSAITKLYRLQKAHKISDKQYVKEKQKLDLLADFQRKLYSGIQLRKLEAQFPPNGQH